jgi:uncharacterized delta-60 repeat protein
VPFGDVTVTTTSVSDTGDSVYDLAQLPDGRLVTLFTYYDSASVLQYGLRFFGADGHPDQTTGGGTGRVPITLPITAEHLTVQGNKIVVTGEILNPQGNETGTIALARFNADGSPDDGSTNDTTPGDWFGSNGLVTIDLDWPRAVAVQPVDSQSAHDKILVMGNVGGELAVLRYTADGTLDAGFGLGGEVRTPVAPSSFYRPALVVQPNGKILVGEATEGTHHQGAFTVLRYTADGSLDTDFGDHDPNNPSLRTGWVNGVEFASELIEDPISLTALAVEPNGGIVAAGTNGLVRYTSDGQIDTSFGDPDPDHPGLRTGALAFVGSHYYRNQSDLTASPPTPALQTLLAAGVAHDSNPAGVVVQADGQILVAGAPSGVVRLNSADGSLDTSFGPDRSGLASFLLFVSGVLRQAGGRLALVGNINTEISLVRVATAPAYVVAGQAVTLDLSATDPSPYDQNPTQGVPHSGEFTFEIDWDEGKGFERQPIGLARQSFTHAYASARTYTIRAHAFDKDNGLSADVCRQVTIYPVTTDNLKTAIKGSLPADAAGNPSLALQITSTDQASQFLGLFTSGSGLTIPPGTIIDLNVDMGGKALPPHAPVSIPDGLHVFIDHSRWYGNSPALTLLSGNLTITNSTFANATNAPTILVTGGRLTLRNDAIQESTGYNQVAISVTGGTVDLGTAASPGGNTLNVNGSGAFAQNTTATPISAVGDAFTVNGAPLTPSSLSGIVWEDFNDDGQVDFGEKGIAGVTITLTGTDDLGNSVNLAQTTDADGAYVFLNLRPGTYSITETQPAGYLQGTDSVGTAGGSLAATDQFLIPLGVEVNGLNYNFGEQPAATGAVKKGQAAGIGFWNNKNGQALIKAFNGGTPGTNWPTGWPPPCRTCSASMPGAIT